MRPTLYTMPLLLAAMLPMTGRAQVPSITTIAGDLTDGYSGDDGLATLAAISPNNLAIDGNGDIYFTQWPGDRIRRIKKSTGIITTVVGGGWAPYPNDGQLAGNIVLTSGAGYSAWGGIAVDSGNNLYFPDQSPGGLLIRRVDAVTGIVSTVAGGGPCTNIVVVGPTSPYGPIESVLFASGNGIQATSAYLFSVDTMVIDGAGNIYFTDFVIVRRVDAVTGVITTVAGDGRLINPLAHPEYTLEGVHSGDGDLAIHASFTGIEGVCLDPAGNIYVTERDTVYVGTGGGTVRKVSSTTGVVTTIVGSHALPSGYTGDGGPASAATLGGPWGLACDAAGNLYIAERDNNVVRRVDAATGIITTIAGNGLFGYAGDGGPALSATLGGPFCLAFDPMGNLHVAEYSEEFGSHFRKIDLNPNAPPTANAGPDQSLHASGLVSLDGSASFDDNTPSASLSYYWILVAWPFGSGATLESPLSAYPTFVADRPGTYVVELVVQDVQGLVSPIDEVVISSINLAPTASAGPDLGGVVSQLVQLDGAASSDPEDDPLTYSWTITSRPIGSATGLANAFSANPTFVPDLPGAYAVGLVVDDGFGPSVVDEAVITVVTGQQFAQTTTATAITTIATLPPASVTTGGNQQALGNFLTQAVQSLQANNPATARLKLQAAIERTDGWKLRNAADQNGPGRDWVTDRPASIALYDQLKAALDALN